MTNLERLQQLLHRRYPDARVDIDQGPNGRRWLNVRMSHQFFVVGYQPRHGYSLDSVDNGDSWGGFSQGFSPPSLSFSTVAKKLFKTLSVKDGKSRTRRTHSKQSLVKS